MPVLSDRQPVPTGRVPTFWVRFGVLLATLAAVEGLAAQGNGEFDAHGFNALRIENEAKLRVPLEIEDAVWQWMQQHYRDPQWLAERGQGFTTTTGDEHFVDTYFDTPDLRLLADQSGVRMRSRVVRDGSAMRKDGRQLLQIKINRGDQSGLARGEIKFEVEPGKGKATLDSRHPMLGLVTPSQRDECKARLRELGYDPYAMRPVLTVVQDRRRVYVSDAGGALATITLDSCTCRGYGAGSVWTEIELELNEIRYTEADQETRRWMEGLNKVMQADLQARFPAIVQDQTPKYSKAFAMLEANSWLPVRRMIRFGLTFEDALWTAGLVALVAVGALVLFARQRRRRGRGSAVVPPAPVPARV